MSLIRIAARMAAVEAIKGATLVGDNVLDSQIGALDIGADGSLRTLEDRPFISVYADEAKSDNNVMRFLLNNGPTQFLFEAGITAAMIDTDPETGSMTMSGMGIPGTDAAFEFHLDLVIRQIADALTDPDNEWAEIWRRMSLGFESVSRVRTSGDGSGVRLAAHQLRVTANLIGDPSKGTILKDSHPLSMFFAKAATADDAVFQEKVDAMKAQLVGGTIDWKLDVQRYGMTLTEAHDLQFTPPEGMPDNLAFSEVVALPAELTNDPQ